MQGLTIATDSSLRLAWLNRTLKKKRFVCRIVKEQPWTLRFLKALPPLFEIYELKVKNMQGGVRRRWSIAFNQNAYFLDCVRFEGEQPNGEGGE